MERERFFRFLSLKQAAGIPHSSKRLRELQRVRRPRLEWTGPSLQWWTSRATHAGDASPKEQVKTHTSAPQWRQRECAVSRVTIFARATELRRPPNTSPLTAALKADVTTMSSTHPSARCAKCICRRFMQQPVQARQRSWLRSTKSPAYQRMRITGCSAMYCVANGDFAAPS